MTGAPESDDAPHTLTLFATVDFKHQLTTWQEAERLRPFHFWTAETIRERFEYTDNAGISLAFLRVWRMSPAWTFPHQSRYGGCRSWLELPNLPGDPSLSPVLGETQHAERLAAVRAALTLF
jgi:hypothetical protein